MVPTHPEHYDDEARTAAIPTRYYPSAPVPVYVEALPAVSTSGHELAPVNSPSPLVPFKAMIGGEEVDAVNARELHAQMNSHAQFTDWFARRCERGGLARGKDYATVEFVTPKPRWGGHNRTDYAVTVDAAMHIATLERTELGCAIRQDLIDWKEQAKSMDTPDATEPVNVEQPPAADNVATSQETETAPTPQASVVALEPTTNLPAVVQPSKALAVNSPFSFEGFPVRVEKDDNGEPIFVARDVVEALGATWAGNLSVQHVPDQWRVVKSVLTIKGARDAVFLTEQGVYFYLNRSDKPKALPIQMWIAGEVLPSIRKTGGYGVQAPRELTRMEILQMAMESETKAIAYQRAAEEAAALAVMHEEEKVEAERKFGVAKGALVRLTGGNAELHSLTEAGKQAGVNPKRFINRLIDEHILYRTGGGGRLVAYQRYIDKGWFHDGLVGPAGEAKYAQTRVTAKGLAALAALAEKWGMRDSSGIHGSADVWLPL